MRELTQVTRFFSKNIEDEMRIYRGQTYSLTDLRRWHLNEYGATLCTPDREATPLTYPRRVRKKGAHLTPPRPCKTPR